MAEPLQIAVLISLAAVAFVLGLGLWNMLCAGDSSLSQKLMRWRIGLQLLAVILIMAAAHIMRLPAN